MANICSSTPIRDTSIKGLTAELNFLRSTICTLQSQVINGGGGGGPTIYTGDGNLGGNRSIGLVGHSIKFINGSDEWLKLEPSSHSVFLQTTDGTGSAFLGLTDDAGGNNIVFDLQAYNGVDFVDITGDAVAKTIAFTAANGLLLNGNPFNTIYTGDGSLPGDRTVTLGTHSLVFDGGAGASLEISPSEGYVIINATNGLDMSKGAIYNFRYLSFDTTVPSLIIMAAPDGGLWDVSINNSGVLVIQPD